MKDFGKIQTGHAELQKSLSGLTKHSVGGRILILGEAGSGRRLLAQIIHEKSTCADREIIRYSPERKMQIPNNSLVLVSDVQFFNFSEQEMLAAHMEIGANIWVVTAQPDFHELGQRGLIRKDLFKSFTTQISMPNLKERSMDLPFLVEQILMTLSWVTGRVLRLSRPAMTALENHSWNENIRELEHLLETAALSTTGSVIELADLKLSTGFVADVNQILTLAEMERKLILQTLHLTQNNKSHAARLLGISIRTLRNKLSQYKTEPQFQDAHIHQEML